MAFRLQDEAKQLKGLFKDLVSLHLYLSLKRTHSVKFNLNMMLFSVIKNCSDPLKENDIQRIQNRTNTCFSGDPQYYK